MGSSRTGGEPALRAAHAQVARIVGAVPSRVRDAAPAPTGTSPTTGAFPTTATPTAALRALEPYGWAALHGVHHPGRPLGSIEHVVVGPGGVVVVDVRSWPGRLHLHDGALRHDGEPVALDLERALAAAAAVTALLAPQHRSAVRAVVCAPDRHVGPVVDACGATVVGVDDLAAHLRALPPRLTPAEMAGLHQLLDLHLGGERCPDQLTTSVLGTDRRRRAVRVRTADHSAQSSVLPSAAGRAPQRRTRSAATTRAVARAAAVWCLPLAVAVAVAVRVGAL
ncbi:NERD domain-containing protein [Cellulomonas iranensis]|uniref:NERD domain-containing protein n=1 Tax=Cellulomonas iranensis TaxID=76862 RepID=A0ABU0GJH7_9CELL|nr:NERD domain-containing protein [Cellulomonas iranensis]MDQ0425522.1 hypothetical protein [Cellulomonas iranensis]